MAQLVLVFVRPADEWYVERVLYINNAEIMGFIPSLLHSSEHLCVPVILTLCIPND
jgi:hypothetical protein